MIKPHAFLKAIILSLFLFPAASAWALTKPFDHSIWDQFLKTFVNEKGEVNYRAVKDNPKLLDDYLEKIKSIERDSMSTWPREERLALLINVYNASIIRMVLQHYPLKSIQDIPGVWEIAFVKVAMLSYSLNTIRHGELMTAFHDEKINTALACSARSCPPLSRTAYTGPEVEGQLFLAAKRFANDPERNVIEPAKKKVMISRLFKWYAGDFSLDFGSFENDKGLKPDQYAVLSFLAHYLDDMDKIRFLEQGGYKLKYLPFDWTLNDWQPSSSSAES